MNIASSSKCIDQLSFHQQVCSSQSRTDALQSVTFLSLSHTHTCTHTLTHVTHTFHLLVYLCNCLVFSDHKLRLYNIINTSVYRNYLFYPDIFPQTLQSQHQIYVYSVNLTDYLKCNEI